MRVFPGPVTRGVHYSTEHPCVCYCLWVFPESSEILRAPGLEGSRAAEVRVNTRQSCGSSPGLLVPVPGPSHSVGVGEGLGPWLSLRSGVLTLGKGPQGSRR